MQLTDPQGITLEHEDTGAPLVILPNGHSQHGVIAAAVQNGLNARNIADMMLL